MFFPQSLSITNILKIYILHILKIYILHIYIHSLVEIYQFYKIHQVKLMCQMIQDIILVDFAKLPFK